MSISFVMQALKFQDGSPENQPVRKEIPFQEPSFSGYSCYTLGGGIKTFTHDPCDVVWKNSLAKAWLYYRVCFMFWDISILAPLEHVFTIPHVQTVKQSVWISYKKTFMPPTLLVLKTSRYGGYSSLFMINTDECTENLHNSHRVKDPGILPRWFWEFGKKHMRKYYPVN